jgi:hypothetical protein
MPFIRSYASGGGGSSGGGAGSGTVGPGSTNLLAKFTAADTVGDSSITDDGSLVSTALPVSAGSFRGASIGPDAAKQHTVPNVASDTIALLAATQTLTNKTLTAPVLGGSVTGTYTIAGTPTLASDVIASSTPDLGTSGARMGDGFFTNLNVSAAITSPTIGVDSDSQHTLPNVAADTVTLNAATQTLTNKTLTAPVLGGTVTGTYTLGGTPTIPAASLSIASQDTGDVLYASSSSAWARLASSTAGKFLRAGGASTAPAWSTTVWPNSATQGDLIAATSANTMGSIAAVAAGQALISNGTGAVPVYTNQPELIFNDATTNTVVTMLTLTRQSSGTAATGIGSKISFKLDSADEEASEAGYIKCLYNNGGAGAEITEYRFGGRVAGVAAYDFFRVVVAGSSVLLYAYNNSDALQALLTLASTTTINTPFVPQSDTSYTLGSSIKRWTQVWATQHCGVVNTVGFSGTPTFTSSNGNTQKITLTANITSWTVPAGQPDECMTLLFIQGGSGSYTLAAPPANVKLAGGTITLTTTVGKADAITLRYDGSNWYEISRSQNL